MNVPLPYSILAECLSYQTIYPSITSTTSMRIPHNSLRSLLLLCSLPLLLILSLPVELLSQESFPATHIAVLSGTNQQPPVNGAGYGLLIGRFDPTSRSLEYRLSVTGLGETIAAAHFHSGGPEATGDAAHAITFPNGRLTATGVWENIPAATADSLLRGLIYVNIHTASAPEGKIRGQIQPIPNAGVYQLDPGNEVPPILPSNSEGSGDATITVDPQTRTARYVARWCCMTGPATMAHFHRAARGENGAVVHALTMNPGDSVVEGVWSGLSDQDIADIRSGNIYLNVHTDQYPNGEIRGQVIPIATFTAAVSSKNEVPATSTSAEGTGFVGAFGEQSQEFPLFGEFVVEGLTGPITMAHIHRGAVGTNGGAAFDLDQSAYPNLWHLETSIPDPTNRAELVAGRMYANFHTAANQNGEARGQLVPALLNWDAISAAPSEPVTGEAPKFLSAFDKVSNRLLFRWNGRSNEGKVILFNLLGRQVAEANLTDGATAIDAATLPAAPYLAQLLVDGTPTDVSRVMVAIGAQ